MRSVFSSKFYCTIGLCLLVLLFFATTTLAQLDRLDRRRPPKPPPPPAENVFTGRVHPEVRDVAQRQERIKVIVYLTEQPAFEISSQEKATRSLVLRGIANQLEQLTRPFGLNDVVPGPVRVQVRALGKQREVILEEMRADIYSRTQASVQAQQQRFQQFVEIQLNGIITAQIILANCFGIEIPAEMLERLEQHPDVSRITLDHPLELDLQGSTLAIGADTWWNNGFTGPGWYDAAVLDTGVTFNPGNPNGLSSKQGLFPDDFNNYTGPVGTHLRPRSQTFRSVFHQRPCRLLGRSK
jgi:hypothetical protein